MMPELKPASMSKLNELDDNEMFDVGRALNPDYTREQFEADWKEFLELKAAHEKKKEAN